MSTKNETKKSKTATAKTKKDAPKTTKSAKKSDAESKTVKAKRNDPNEQISPVLDDTTTDEMTVPENVAEESSDLSYEIDDISDLVYEDDSDETEGHAEPDEEEEIDFSDPLQYLLNAYYETLDFPPMLNKKEDALIVALAANKKFVADFTQVEAETLESIKKKYAALIVPESDEQEPLEEFRKPDSTAMALAKVEDTIIIPEEDAPLTEDEKQELATREKAIQDAKNAFEKAPFVMSENLSEIRRKKLHRETGLTFEQYVAERFGITREYGQALARGGDFRHVLAEISPEALQLAGSINSNEQWAKDTNKIAYELGFTKSEFKLMQPIIKVVSEIVTEVATDEHGKLNSVAPRIFAAANEKIPEIIEKGIVEVGGEQMLIKDALKLGADFLTENIKTQIVEAVGEQLLARKQSVIDFIKESQERRVRPHSPATQPTNNGKEYYKGDIPTDSATCSRHPITEKFTDNFVKNVFNAGYELACGCKWQRLVGHDGFQCIECEGLPVKHD